MNHKGTFHFYKYPLPLPHPASLDLTTSSRRWRMRYGISGLAGNTGLTRSTVLRHDLGGGGNLPRNPGAPNDEVSLAGMEVDLVMLLPLQIIVVNEQILRERKTRLFTVDGFTTAVLRFSGDLESFRNLLYQSFVPFNVSH